MKSPIARPLQYCRQEGMMAGVTEKWIPLARKRQDLFGFIDLIAIQATSGSNVSSRVNRIASDCQANVRKWLQANNRIEVWGWRRVKLKRGGKAVRWEPRRVGVTLGDLVGDG